MKTHFKIKPIDTCVGRFRMYDEVRDVSLDDTVLSPVRRPALVAAGVRPVDTCHSQLTRHYGTRL